VRSVSRRVLVLWIVTLALAALAGAWFHHALGPPDTDERVRTEAERIKERVRSLTH
jgi:hypothetical protein